MLNFFGSTIGGVTVYVGGLLRDGQVNINRVFQFAALSLLGCALLLFAIKPLPATSS